MSQIETRLKEGQYNIKKDLKKFKLHQNDGK